MLTKLTLTIDKSVIEQAKEYNAPFCQHTFFKKISGFPSLFMQLTSRPVLLVL